VSKIVGPHGGVPQDIDVLQEKMGLDAVEMVIAVEQTFDIVIPDAEAAEMITPALLIAYVQNAVEGSSDERSCISQRAFHLVRAELIRILKVARSAVTLQTSISTLFPRESRTENWNLFRAQSCLRSLPDLRFGRGWVFSPTSVRDLVLVAVSQESESLTSSKSWSRSEVREVVRQIISEQLGIKRFSDSDEFVQDLGVD
jgi:acyl carrier protein